MRYKWTDIPALLRTPLGRLQIVAGLWHRSWPLLSRLATLYRSTAIRNTRIVAVVGSFGKSTTTRAVCVPLGGKDDPILMRNSGYAIAHAIFRIRPRDRHSTIEVGIHRPGQMKPYARIIHPNITVVTSIGSEHNRSFGTLDNARSEK